MYRNTLRAFPLAGAAQVDLGWEVERTLFPPELVWENREAISLDWEQQKQMTEAIAGVRARAAELEAGIWQSTVALAETLDSDWINADEALTPAEWSTAYPGSDEGALSTTPSKRSSWACSGSVTHNAIHSLHLSLE